MPHDWFPPETHALLVQLCRHISTANHLAELIKAIEPTVHPEDSKAYTDLLRVQQAESAAICQLATKMRLSQQTRRSPDLAASRLKNRPKIDNGAVGTDSRDP